MLWLNHQPAVQSKESNRNHPEVSSSIYNTRASAPKQPTVPCTSDKALEDATSPPHHAEHPQRLRSPKLVPAASFLLPFPRVTVSPPSPLTRSVLPSSPSHSFRCDQQAPASLPVFPCSLNHTHLHAPQILSTQCVPNPN